MPRVYELPTHLQVEDQLIAGLTARQLLRLVIGASLAYGVWDQVPWLPQQARLALAGGLAATGVIFALLQPRGRPLDAWLLAAALFVVLPRQLVWRPGANPQRKPQPDQAGWAELELDPEWVEPQPDRQLALSDSPAGRAQSSSAGQRQVAHRGWLW